MNDLEAGTFVMMVKNDDGSFSPVGLKEMSGLYKPVPYLIQPERMNHHHS